MTFDSLIARLIDDTTKVSLGLFAPELILSAAIVLLLLVRLFDADRFLPPFAVAALAALAGLIVSGWEFYELNSGRIEATQLFTGLLTFDAFTVFFRMFLTLFLLFVVALTRITGIPDREDGPDFYTLLLGATIGMMLMAAANNILILFLGVEMASVPSYAMVGFLKGRKLSSEASLKFVVYGAGAAGVMLYGASLLTGLLGTANFTEIALRLGQVVGQHGIGDPTARTALLAAVMVLVGLAFKLSIVPFHFWCPDAFEGAAAEVGGFLSVASKAAAFALLVRFCIAIIGDQSPHLAALNLTLGIGLGLVAALTATFGNLAAYAQTNVKRILAYSTIANAGYMLMAVASMMVLLNSRDPQDHAYANEAVQGLMYYLVVYFFMNLGAFAVVALIRNQIFSEELDSYNGLIHELPLYCVCMGVCLFSLIGLPPFGGFFAKWMVFASLVRAGYVSKVMWFILAIGGLNTVFGLFYYVRILKAMTIAPRPALARRAEETSEARSYLLAVTAPVLLTFICLNPILKLTSAGATPIVSAAAKASAASQPAVAER